MIILPTHAFRQSLGFLLCITRKWYASTQNKNMTQAIHTVLWAGFASGKTVDVSISKFVRQELTCHKNAWLRCVSGLNEDITTTRVASIYLQILWTQSFVDVTYPIYLVWIIENLIVDRIVAPVNQFQYLYNSPGMRTSCKISLHSFHDAIPQFHSHSFENTVETPFYLPLKNQFKQYKSHSNTCVL